MTQTIEMTLPADQRAYRMVIADHTGRHPHMVVDWSREQVDAFYQRLSDFFDEGVARYGSVDEFARVLRWANSLRDAERAA